MVNSMFLQLDLNERSGGSDQTLVAWQYWAPELVAPAPKPFLAQMAPQ